MELIRAGRITIDEMITHRLPLEEVQAGFMLTARSEENLKVIIEPQN